MSDELSRKIEVYKRQGWYPVKWAHHPQPIKDALRRIGLRPQMKNCYANCQRFVLWVEQYGIDLDVTYHEGWVNSIIPFEHAWLVYEGKIVDLTLNPDDKERVAGIEYLESTAYTAEQVRVAMIKNRMYGPIDHEALARLSPYNEWFKGMKPPNT